MTLHRAILFLLLTFYGGFGPLLAADFTFEWTPPPKMAGISDYDGFVVYFASGAGAEVREEIAEARSSRRLSVPSYVPTCVTVHTTLQNQESAPYDALCGYPDPKITLVKKAAWVFPGQHLVEGGVFYSAATIEVLPPAVLVSSKRLSPSAFRVRVRNDAGGPVTLRVKNADGGMSRWTGALP